MYTDRPVRARGFADHVHALNAERTCLAVGPVAYLGS